MAFGAALLAPGVVGAVLVWLVAGRIPGIVVLALYGVAVTVAIGAQARAVLRAAGATRVLPGEQSRLENLANGVSRDLRVPPPRIYVFDSGPRNALATWDGGAPAIALGRSFIDACARTELEAVVTHCLLRATRAGARRNALLSAAGRLARPTASRVGMADDLSAVAITRYPPALASAIGKAEPYSGRFAPFWFVATGTHHDPPEERIEQLGDL